MSVEKEEKGKTESGRQSMGMGGGGTRGRGNVPNLISLFCGQHHGRSNEWPCWDHLLSVEKAWTTLFLKEYHPHDF